MSISRVRTLALAVSAVTALSLGVLSATAQQRPPAAPIKPYAKVAVTIPPNQYDPSFDAFREKLDEATQKKDIPALNKLVATKGFFWEGEKGDRADKSKTSIQNLVAALGLNKKDADGWNTLGDAAQEIPLEAVPKKPGVVCGPASPKFDFTALEALVKATWTDFGDWGFPTNPETEVRTTTDPKSAVLEKIGLHLIRVMQEEVKPGQPQPTALKVVLPSGKAGFVALDAVAPLFLDQTCFIKEADGWKLIGVIGGVQ